jgi:thiol-disulfide isomerase/thioredoxin
MIAYTLFTLARTMQRRRYIIPQNRKEWNAILGDVLTIAATIFVLFILKNNYEAPIEAVMQYKGKEIPAFSFYNTKTGKTESIDLYKNKVVILNIWATWCPPCRREMPDLDKLYSTFKDNGVEVIAISDEDPVTIGKFLEQHPYSFNSSYFTVSNELMNSIQTRPVSILLARGRVKDIVIGARGFSFFSSWVKDEINSR